MADWATISSLATAGGTLVLAIATYASVRSANRAARVAEASLLEQLRPIVVSSRIEDPPEKVNFADNHWVRVPGGHATAEVDGDVIYLTMALRNVGNGLAVLHGWYLHPEAMLSAGAPNHAPLDDFRRLSRDIYIAARDRGFWQGALRDPADPLFRQAAEAIAARRTMGVELLYGDLEGGQRTITRFGLVPFGDDGGWLASTARHWNIDRGDPR